MSQRSWILVMCFRVMFSFIITVTKPESILSVSQENSSLSAYIFGFPSRSLRFALYSQSVKSKYAIHVAQCKFPRISNSSCTYTLKYVSFKYEEYNHAHDAQVPRHYVPTSSLVIIRRLNTDPSHQDQFSRKRQCTISGLKTILAMETRSWNSGDG